MNRNGLKSTKVSIVIPALNESKGIEKTIRTIPLSELNNMGYNVQVLVVDNGSTDDTSDIARRAGAEVVFEPKRGYGHAYKAGFAGATGDIIATSDADATYPLEDIPRLVKIIDEQKIDFITTNRLDMMKKGAMSMRNQIGNRILSLTMKVLYGININDSQSGMWIFKKEILDGLKINYDDWRFSQELKIEACYYSNANWVEVPIHYYKRFGDSNGGNWKVGFTDLIHLFEKRLVRKWKK